MAASRVVNRNRWCRRHFPFFAVGVAILVVQVFLGYCFYTVPSSDDGADEYAVARTRHEAGKSSSESQGSHGRQQSAQSDDEYDEDESPARQRPVARRGATPAGANASEAVDWSQLGFEPACEITEKDALSAIRRATSLHCRRELANVTCLAQAGTLYPARLPRSCESASGREATPGRSLGCYQDDRQQRLLERLASRSRSNGPSHCVGLCLRLGYPWAGLEYGLECFCGKGALPPQERRLPDDRCTMACPSNATVSCGGYLALHVFATGISSVLTKKESVWPVVGAVPPPARIAFLLSVNGRAVRQVLRLLKALYHERHVFYIHVDARQGHMHRALSELESRLGNVVLARERLATIWGGSSLLEMLLGAMEHLLRDHPHWDYLVNLSETDFPLKPRERLEEFLAANMGSNFVKSHGQDTQRFISKQALERTFHECGGRMWRLGPRQLPWGLRLDGGSDWVALHRDFCSYVALPERQDALLAGLRSLFGHTLLPAESFFHTALQNSAFCSSVVDNNLRLVNWKRRQGCQCQHRHVVDWCGCSPNVFRPDDWHRIRATRDRPVFFARKFEPVVSRRIVDQLERWISDPTSEASTAPPVVADAGYWQSQYETLDDDATVEDHQLTAYQSLTRLALSRAEFTCSRPPEGGLHVRGVSLYFYGDQFQGLLVSWGSPSASTEAFLSPRNHRRNGDADLPASARLRLLQVGSQYDPKEQMLRDFPRLLGPRSEPGALHSWGAGRALAVTFVWVDPAKVVAGSYEVRVESGPQTLFHRPEFRKPLRPGAWTLLVFYEWRLVGQTRFLVLPVAPVAGGAEATAEVNGGPRGPYIDHDLSRVEEHLGYSRETRTALKAQADADGRRTGRELERWVDALIAEFWTFQGACSIRGGDAAEGDRCGAGLPTCGKTEWSSFSYDATVRVGQVPT
ncbi:unnamed protein product [Ixodes pacificus]